MFNYSIGGNSERHANKLLDLAEILKKNNIHEVLDERFFLLLEQIVHPYTRPNDESSRYLSIINQHLKNDNLFLSPAGEISGQSIYKVIIDSGVQESVKNIIFASSRYKPEIVLDDALSNRIKIVRNSEYCLVYDRPIKPSGLLWVEIVEWWSDLQGKPVTLEQAQGLKTRLSESLASEPEKILFECYFKALGKSMQRKLPALIPQVYLHYDPYSIKQYGIQYLLRQRMDFLLLLSNTKRIVIEVDGKQHYAVGDVAKPEKYAEMVSLDRELKLLGYEVYRFGGYELTVQNETAVVDFFQKLFKKHDILNED